ncbi:hypothetical protein RND81_12G202400 [Saponaria officinalis]|uniref:Uncharacterized protein n=1 Tax=Saponaria officinalis TaxID=3572 RepID=A0AAW1HD06_SAPOF
MYLVVMLFISGITPFAKPNENCPCFTSHVLFMYLFINTRHMYIIIFKYNVLDVVMC